MNKLFTFVLGLALATASVSCKHAVDVVNPDSTDSTGTGSHTSRPGKVCPIGTAAGTAVTTTIGPEGGKLLSEDERLTITVPAGAVETPQTFSIQPIESTAPQAVGVGYRLMPHGTTFKKPVTLTLRYEPQMLMGSIPEALGLAYQNSKGVYMLAANYRVDSTARTVSVQTTHFSDWNLLQRLALKPQVGYTFPGRTLDLVVELTDDLLPLPPSDELEIPDPAATPSRLIDPASWRLSGAGKLTPKGHQATYQAPASIPARNPVAVNVRLRGSAVADGKPSKEIWLVTNIYIGQEGLTYRINNGPWVSMTASPTLGGAYIAGGYLFLSTGSSTGTLGLTIITPRPQYEFGGGKIVFDPIAVPWSVGKTPTAFNLSDYANGGIMHLHYYKQQVSEGTLNIHQFGPVGSWVTGTFELTRAGILHPTNGFTGTAQIEGFFRLARVREK